MHLLIFFEYFYNGYLSLSDSSVLSFFFSFLAFSANGKDVIVDFPQQSHWTGLLSEMELVPSVHPGVRCGSV